MESSSLPGVTAGKGAPQRESQDRERPRGKWWWCCSCWRGVNTACKQGQADNPHVGCLSGALALLYSLKTITSGFKEVPKKTVKSRQRSSGHSDFCDNSPGSEVGLGCKSVSTWAHGESTGQVLARKGCQEQVHVTWYCLCFRRRAGCWAGRTEERVVCRRGWCAGSNTFWFWCLKRQTRYQTESKTNSVEEDSKLMSAWPSALNCAFLPKSVYDMSKSNLLKKIVVRFTFHVNNNFGQLLYINPITIMFDNQNVPSFTFYAYVILFLKLKNKMGPECFWTSSTDAPNWGPEKYGWQI